MFFTPIILVHLLTALGAVALGGLMFMLKKGSALHRLSGRLWVVLMTISVPASFVVRTHGHFSWIHLLSVWFLFVIGMALYAIYRGNISAHRRWMTGGYIGLVAAGAFALLPYRGLGNLVWHAAAASGLVL